MWGRNISHIYSIQHYWDDIVGKDFPELFCDVVLAERVLQGEVELYYVDIQVVICFIINYQTPLCRSCSPSPYSLRYHPGILSYCRRLNHRYPQGCILSVSSQNPLVHCKYCSWRQTTLPAQSLYSFSPSQLNVYFPHQTDGWTFLKQQLENNLYLFYNTMSYRDHPCLVQVTPIK